ncbi:MAG: hypothetical protein ACFE0R_17815 [Salinarimonas sp.]
MSGAGTVDLPQQRLAFTVEPRIAVEQRRGEGIRLVGFGTPVRIEGPWARPRIYPDVAGVLQDPMGTYERLRELGTGVFGIDAPSSGEVLERAVGAEAARGLERLLGVPPAPAQGAPPADPASADVAPTPAAPRPDPAVEAARGLLDMLLNNR